MDRQWSVASLADRLGGVVRGDGDTSITGVNTIDDAGDNEVAFISTQIYAARWPASRAAAAIVAKSVIAALEEKISRDPRPVIIVQDAERAMIDVLAIFAPPPTLPAIGVHPDAVIEDNVRLGDNVRIGPLVWIGAGAVIGDETTLHTGSRVYPNAVVGDACVLHSGAVVRERCVLGDRVVLHNGVCIGADGFGYRPDETGTRLLKMEHIGNVIVGDDVEIGANSCVDRGKFGPTRIGNQVKIDNLVQIGHNVQIGDMTVIASQAGISGSAKIGRGVLIGGQVGMIEHLTIGDGARIGAGSGLMKDVEPGQVVLGSPADEFKNTMRQWAAMRKLGRSR